MLHFEIIDEGDDYLVVNKPPFLLIHPTKPNGLPTLWRQLRELLAFEIASGGQVSIVNRLDRETSGLVLVAKTGAAARDFGLLMQRQQLRKEYLAIVWGWPEWEDKIVDAPLDRQGKHQKSAILAQTNDSPCGRTSADGIFCCTAVQRVDVVRRALQPHSCNSAHRTHSSDSGASHFNRPPDCRR